jgi:hypothetical protein
MKNGLLMATAALLGMMAITPAQAATYTFDRVTPGNADTVLGLEHSESSNGITLTAFGLTEPANPTAAGPDLAAGSAMCDSADVLPAVTIHGGLTTQTQKTPEPGGLLMAGTALIVIGVLMKKKQKKA